MTTDMSLILGLDISTAVTGFAVLFAHDGSLRLLDYVDTRKIKSLWRAADAVKEKIETVAKMGKFEHLFIEEDLRRFRSGFSSAHTISMLAKMNGIISYIARSILCVEPTYIQSSRARSLCGIKLSKPTTPEEKADSRWTKKQVFEQVVTSSSDLEKISWTKTRPTAANPNGRIRDENYDMIDAYVVARAGWLMTQQAYNA